MMASDKKYREELAAELRMREVSGEHVGDVLAEIETHVAETGEDPADAFGAPGEYATRVAAQLKPGVGKRSTADTLTSMLGAAGSGLFGMTFLLDGIWPEGSAVQFSTVDAAKAGLTLIVVILGAVLLFRKVTETTKLSGNSGASIVILTAVAVLVPGYALIGAGLGEGAVLFEMPPWGATVLGVALLLGTAMLVLRAIRYGRVVDPR